MSIAVQPEDISYQAGAFDRLAEDVERVVAHLRAPALSGEALAGPELRPAHAAFEGCWRRCSGDLAALAESLHHVAAAVRASGHRYRESDAATAAAGERLSRAL